MDLFKELKATKPPSQEIRILTWLRAGKSLTPINSKIMKKTLKFLNRISKIKGLEPENYYSITIDCSGLKLQGDYQSELVEIIQKYMITVKITDSGYIEFIRGELKILLT